MKYPVSEKFKSVQGEGVFTGTPMAFIRLVGCSVGKRVCHACDTDFEEQHVWRGGGAFTEQELIRWAEPYTHVCITGGEPLNHDLLPLIEEGDGIRFHIETSGTVLFPEDLETFRYRTWICVSPKPGYSDRMLERADEIKVIVPGLGSDSGWPTLQDAKRWAKSLSGTVFIQPRNLRHDLDANNLRIVLELVRENPELRLSLQLHKVLRVQ